MNLKLNGIPTSSGIAIGQIHQLKETVSLPVEKQGKGIDFEFNRFKKALSTAKDELNTLYLEALSKVGENEASILDAQKLMLEDPLLIDSTFQRIQADHLSAEFAFRLTMSELIDLFDVSDNLYTKERASDLKDLQRRVLLILAGLKGKKDDIKKDVILVAEEMMPSDTLGLDKKYIKGIITQKGSKTSHAAILARQLGIPSVSGIEVSKLTENTLVIIDGNDGLVLTNPLKEELKRYLERQSVQLKKQASLQELYENKAQTSDAKFITLRANMSDVEDLALIQSHGAEGIGLFRTENQYMKSASFPTEETLYASYKEVLSAFKDEKVVIRTLDIGGDKPLSYLPRTHELNPFLGLRGIRFSLSYQSIFVKQLRALLKANTHGNLSIMLPMISTKEEIIASKKLVDEAILSLKDEFIEVQRPHIGIMIEVPSAALQIDVLSKQVDFVSIGTNDLLQYIFAADRMNEEVTHLYQPYHPTFLKLLKSIIDHGHQNKVEVSVCGEMASDSKQALLLIGLGIDVLSMNAHAIPYLKYLLSQVKYDTLVEMAEKALLLESNEAVKDLINTYYEKLSH